MGCRGQCMFESFGWKRFSPWVFEDSTRLEIDLAVLQTQLHHAQVWISTPIWWIFWDVWWKHPSIWISEASKIESCRLVKYDSCIRSSQEISAEIFECDTCISFLKHFGGLIKGSIKMTDRKTSVQKCSIFSSLKTFLFKWSLSFLQKKPKFLKKTLLGGGFFNWFWNFHPESGWKWSTNWRSSYVSDGVGSTITYTPED